MDYIIVTTHDRLPLVDSYPIMEAVYQMEGGRRMRVPLPLPNCSENYCSTLHCPLNFVYIGAPTVCGKRKENKLISLMFCMAAK